MTIDKESKGLGMPWEKDPGYSQGVKVGDTIYVSGQVSHDDAGNWVGVGDMEAQMRQAYANVAKVLAQYGATMENVVGRVRKDAYGGVPDVADTLIGVPRLAFPELLIEIKCIAVV